ncbi:hypothetical protein Tco_1124805 [Tanacetum coccineum]|uniref:Uncharacterized protein n=1 Tax=Tanacetum coccineum TaxID=301880 RepID=A0ABQ5J8V2_9ASTR
MPAHLLPHISDDWRGSAIWYVALRSVLARVSGVLDGGGGSLVHTHDHGWDLSILASSSKNLHVMCITLMELSSSGTPVLTSLRSSSRTISISLSGAIVDKYNLSAWRLAQTGMSTFGSIGGGVLYSDGW